MGAGQSSRSELDGPKSATVYLLEKEPQPMGGERSVLNAVTVKLGIGDVTSFEVLEGLKEGDVVVTGIAPAASTAATLTRNPLGSPFGGPGRPR